MTSNSVLNICMYIYPAIMAIHVIMACKAQKNRALHAFIFAALLLMFLGLIRNQVFHNTRQSGLLMFAGAIQLLEAGIWMLSRLFTRQGWTQRRHA